MMRPMNFRMPTDDAIHTAFEKGEAAIMELFHHIADQMTALAQQLAKQGEVLQELQARLAKSSHNGDRDQDAVVRARFVVDPGTERYGVPATAAS